MKAKINIVSGISIPLLILFVAMSVKAQTQQELQKFSLHMVRDVNGQEEVISKSFSSKEEMDAYMKQNNINPPGLREIDAPEFTDCTSTNAQHRVKKTVIIETEGDNDGTEAQQDEMKKVAGEKIISFDGNENIQALLKVKGDKEIRIICMGKCDHGTGANQSKADEELHTAIETPASKLSSINVYPNPTGGHFHISFNLAEQGTVSIRILDAQGKEILSQAINDYKGQFEKDIDASTFASGMYTVEIKSGDEIKTSRVIKQ
jgi:hypothetical protein